ncbi:MAG TPA: membrane protein FxsA [Candidatus Omnitrophota bacterium]|nr:membrane protein FxsA [Candidatus Omnitrophota bacterium]HPN57067.1 membrane protein FxsA [Candidatus Omnitrophota bacterium]
MLSYLMALFIIVPTVELYLLIKVGGAIGAANTIFLIIATGALGAALARAQGFAVLRRIQDSLNEGRMPTDDMVNGVMILVGGILLLTPGIITDALGFLLLIPATRDIIKALIHRHFNGILASRSSSKSAEKPFSSGPRVEDAEFRE